MNTKDFKTRSETIHRAAPCPANHWIIGLDIGYSAIKGMSPNKIYSVPAYARKIPADRVRLNEPSETDIYYKQKMVISGLLALWLTMNSLHRM